MSSQSSVDLMKFGIGNLVSDEEGYYQINEFIIGEAIKSFFSNPAIDYTVSAFDAAVDAIAKLIEAHGTIPAKGIFFEAIVFQRLCIREFQGKKILELPFVRPFSSKLLDQTDWLSETEFHCEFMKSNQELDSSTASFLTSPKAKFTLVRPENELRPDGILIPMQ